MSEATQPACQLRLGRSWGAQQQQVLPTQGRQQQQAHLHMLQEVKLIRDLENTLINLCT